jgi:hypothetical protein
MRFLLPLAALLVPFSTPAQAPSTEEPPAAAALENTGKPMRVPFQCGAEEIRTHGLICPAREPCPVYLELSSLEVVGNRIFAAGNLHTQSVTLSSILLATDDGGKTWHEPHQRIRSAGLDQIQFADLEAGWISGQHLLAVPRDPFLLLTTDGGKTWRVRPVYTESRSGLIDGFWFDSRTSGRLWIDRGGDADAGGRYETYESKTGGESWMVREVGERPAAGKPSRPPNPDWRIRADGATQSYQIENRADGRWQSVASFLVRAGECREPEVQLPPPPEPEPQPEVPEPAETEPRPARKPPSLKPPPK